MGITATGVPLGPFADKYLALREAHPKRLLCGDMWPRLKRAVDDGPLPIWQGVRPMCSIGNIDLSDILESWA